MSIEAALPGVLVVADSGLQSGTKATVSSLRQQLKESPVEVGAMIDRLGSLTDEGYDAYIKSDARKLGDCMNQSHELLVDCGVSHERLDRLVEVAREHNALGAKMTGGGQGGCIIALCENSAAALQVKHAFELAGAAHTWTI